MSLPGGRCLRPVWVGGNSNSPLQEQQTVLRFHWRASALLVLLPLSYSPPKRSCRPLCTESSHGCTASALHASEPLRGRGASQPRCCHFAFFLTSTLHSHRCPTSRGPPASPLRPPDLSGLTEVPVHTVIDCAPCICVVSEWIEACVSARLCLQHSNEEPREPLPVLS